MSWSEGSELAMETSLLAAVLVAVFHFGPLNGLFANHSLFTSQSTHLFVFEKEELPCLRYGTTRADNETNPMTNTTWSSVSAATVEHILRIVYSQRWNSCVILYDNHTWSALQLLVPSLANRHISFILYDVTGIDDTSQRWKLAQEVFCDRGMRHVISIAHHVYTYEFLRQVEEYDRHRRRILGLGLFTQWILTTPSGLLSHTARAATYFDNVVLIERHEVITHNSSSHKEYCSTADISTLMYTKNSREFQSVVIQLPNSTLVANDTFPNTRNGFNRRKLLVGTKIAPPYVIKNLTSDYDGVCMQLLNELADILNFTYEIREPPPEEGWGDRNASGYWEGLVGQLHRQEVDLVVAPLSLTMERALAMDATYPYLVNYLAAVYKKPDPVDEKWKTYLRPFRAEVLFCLAVALIVTTLLVQVLSWFDHTLDTGQAAGATGGENSGDSPQRDPMQDAFPGPSPGDGFWYLYGALLSQGGLRLPQSSSGRMLVTAWWLFSIVMGATYSGNLVAFLTVQVENKPLSALSDLLDQDTYTWGTFTKSSIYTAFVDSKNPVLKEIGNRLIGFAQSDPDVLSLDWSVHLEKVKAGEYVHLSDSMSTEAWVRENCDLDHVIDYSGITLPYTVNLPRHSAFTRLFDKYVMLIVEAGLITKWQRDWFGDNLRCVKPLGTEKPKISVLDVQSVLYVGLIGFGLALIALVLEIVCSKHPRLFSWLKSLGNACVYGCGSSRAKKDQGRDDRRLRSASDSRGDRRQARGMGRGREVDIRRKREGSSSRDIDRESRFDRGRRGSGPEVVAVDEVGLAIGDARDGKRRTFDYSSLVWSSHFLYDTAYARPEDFGRQQGASTYQVGW